MMASLISLKVGGQLDVDFKSNIDIPEHYYEYTRSYSNVDGELVQISVLIVFICMLIMLFSAFFHFLKIMYLHFLYYLVMCQELEDNFTIFIKQTDSTSPKKNEPTKVFSAAQLEFLKKNRAEYEKDDRCSFMRWNHRGCLQKLLCICCRKDKGTYEAFYSGPYTEFINTVNNTNDPGYEKDLLADLELEAEKDSDIKEQLAVQDAEDKNSNQEPKEEQKNSQEETKHVEEPVIPVIVEETKIAVVAEEQKIVLEPFIEEEDDNYRSNLNHSRTSSMIPLTAKKSNGKKKKKKGDSQLGDSMIQSEHSSVTNMNNMSALGLLAPQLIQREPQLIQREQIEETGG